MFFVLLAQLILFSHNSTPHHHNNQANNIDFPIEHHLNIYTDLATDIVEHQIAELFLVHKNNFRKTQLNTSQNAFIVLGNLQPIVLKLSNSLQYIENKNTTIYNNYVVKHQQLRAPPCA